MHSKVEIKNEILTMHSKVGIQNQLIKCIPFTIVEIKCLTIKMHSKIEIKNEIKILHSKVEIQKSTYKMHSNFQSRDKKMKL